MSLTITVTADDIARGEPRIGELCPVALAVRRAGLVRAHAGISEVRYLVNGPVTYYTRHVPMPRSARRFVRAFDNGRPVRPFRFRLDVWKEGKP